VGDLRDAIRSAQEAAHRRGGHLGVVASVCGTGADAQDLRAQTRALVEAGVLVFPSSAQAATFCKETMLLLTNRKEAG
jgi:FdrA protein